VAHEDGRPPEPIDANRRVACDPCVELGGDAGERHREAILLSLLSRTYTERVIVFCDTKQMAHRVLLICALSGLNACEVESDLTET
jgi:hypothetical protein